MEPRERAMKPPLGPAMVPCMESADAVYRRGPKTLTCEEPGYLLRGSRDDVSAAECQRAEQLNTLQREVPKWNTHAL